MEMLEDWLKCKCCTETLVKPVLLPCGNSICKYHEEECRNSGSKSIFCSSCELSHDIPETLGFPRVLALEKLLEQNTKTNSNPTDLGDDYKEAMDKYKEFSDLLDEFEKLINDPEMTLHNEFNELRNKVDLRREELKCRIDEDALRIIAQINEYETECKANLPSIKSEEKKPDIESRKVKMGLWKTQLDKPQNDIQFWENINNEIGEHLDTFKSDLEDFEDRVFLNRYYDYSDLYMSIGNDYDMIKDHSLKFVVKNLSQYKDKPLNIKSDWIRALGIDWSVDVSISKDEDQVQYVYMYLSYDPIEKKTENVKITCDLVVVNQIDPSKSIRNECCLGESNDGSDYDDDDEEDDDDENNNDDNDYEDDDYDEEESFDHNNNYRNKEVNKIIKFEDLINDNELYDKENDSFIAQVDIKSIKWSNA